MRHSLLMVLALVACSEPDTTPSTFDVTEGEPDIAWANDGGPKVQAPEIDWLDEGRPPIAPPDFGACREGWLAVDQGGVQVCEPWPEGRKICAGGEAQFPGEAACAPVDAGCAAGDFADELQGEVRYVLPGSIDGDGTLLAPFASAQQAIDSLPTEGGTVALSRGDHTGAVRIDRPVALVGACAEQTRIIGPECDPGGEATVIATTDLQLRSLQITGSTCPGVEAQEALLAQGVVIQDVAAPGLWSPQQTTLERVAVRDVGPGQSYVAVGVGNSLSATDLSIRRVFGAGLSVGTTRTLELNDVAISQVATHEESNVLTGLYAPNPIGSYSGLVVEDLAANGALLYRPSLFEDVVVRGASTPLARGIIVQGTGTATLNRVWVQAEDNALDLRGPEVEVDDALIQGTAQGFNTGVSTQGTAALQLERVVVRGFGTAVAVEADLLALDVVLQGDTTITGNSTIGVYRAELTSGWDDVMSTGAGAEVTLSNVWARGASAGLTYSTFTVEHSLYEINDYPIWGLSPTNLTVSDTVFRQAADAYAVLLDVGSGQLNAERVSFEGGDSFAVEWSDGTATLKDITLTDRLGGMSVVGGELEIERVQMTDIRGVGLAVGFEGTATIRDVILTDTARGEHPERPAVGVFSAGRLLAERVIANGTDGLSVVVDGGEATLNDVMAPDGIVVQRRGSIVGERVQGEVQVDPETLIPAAWGF